MKLKSYRVWLKSVPGFYAQYDGKIDTFGEDDEDAIKNAFSKLKRSFPERSKAMWKVVKIERIYE